jgi:hypothetical protein
MSEERFPCYLRTERVDYLLIVDLVWIVPLLSFLVRRSA